MGKENMHGAFEAWLADLRQVFVLKYGYTEQAATDYVRDAKASWREFFDDDFDPESAAYEDAVAGL